MRTCWHSSARASWRWSVPHSATATGRCALLRRQGGQLSHSRQVFFATSVLRDVARTSLPTSDSEYSPQGRLTASSFALMAPMVLLQEALRQHAALSVVDQQLALPSLPEHLTDTIAVTDTKTTSNSRAVISRQAFNEYCALCHIQDTKAALQLLHEAAVIVSLEDGAYIHLRPVQLLDICDLERRVIETNGTHGRIVPTEWNDTQRVAFPLPPCFVLQEAELRLAEAMAAEALMRQHLEPAIARAARWRRSVWGGALMFAGAQLAIIARLTFFDLSWDIMEPVSYFIGTCTTFLFYLYYLRYDVEHTYSEFDSRFLPQRVKRYAARDFDWDAYDRACSRVVEERKMLDLLRKWASQH